MKKLFHLSWILIFGFLGVTQALGQVKGAWKQTSPDGKTTMLICTDNYLMISRYNEKEFLYTEGGV